MPKLPQLKNENTNNSKSISSRINIAEALKLRLVNHLSYQEIADRYGVCKSTIFQALKRFLAILVEPEELSAYEQHKTALLSSAELKLLERLVNDEVIEKASLNNIAYAFKQVFDSGRLEQGKSTENVDVHALMENIQERGRRLAELRKIVEIGNEAKEIKNDKNT